MTQVPIEQIIQNNSWSSENKKEFLDVFNILGSYTKIFLRNKITQKDSYLEIKHLIVFYKTYLGVMKDLNAFERFFLSRVKSSQSDFGEYFVPLLIDTLNELSQGSNIQLSTSYGVKANGLFNLMPEEIQKVYIGTYIDFYLHSPLYLYNFKRKYFFEGDFGKEEITWGEDYLDLLETCNAHIPFEAKSDNQTVSYWVKRYIEFCTIKQHDVSAYDLIQFMNADAEFKGLVAQDRKKIERLLKLYTWIAYPHLDKSETYALGALLLHRVNEEEIVKIVGDDDVVISLTEPTIIEDEEEIVLPVFQSTVRVEPKPVVRPVIEAAKTIQRPIQQKPVVAPPPVKLAPEVPVELPVQRTAMPVLKPFKMPEVSENEMRIMANARIKQVQKEVEPEPEPVEEVKPQAMSGIVPGFEHVVKGGGQPKSNLDMDTVRKELQKRLKEEEDLAQTKIARKLEELKMRKANKSDS